MSTWKPTRQSHLTIHTQLVDWMKERIQNGEWVNGTKLPPQRKLAADLRVNRSTIVTAIEELIADGLLESKQGSGTYVASNSWNMLVTGTQPDWHMHIRHSIHEPNIHTIQLINEYEQDSTMIRLGTGELAPDLLPVEAMQQTLGHVSLHARDLGYSEPKGSKLLRQVLSEHLKQKGIVSSPEGICIVSGALQAFQLISVGLLERGAYVFQEVPSYMNSIHPFQSAGMRVVSLQRQHSDLKGALKSLKGANQSIFYTVPTLHNPTGETLTIEQRLRLLDACKASRIPVVEDDVYSELCFDGVIPASLKSLDQDGQVLYVGSVSKTLSPGLRIGWIVGPEPVINRLADIKMQTDYGSSGISQQIVAHWIGSGLYEQHIQQLRVSLQERCRYMLKLLEEQMSGIAVWNIPTGGFYIWLRFHEPIVNKALFLQLAKQHVLINPGYIYDPQDAHHIRLSYAYADLEQLEYGLRLLGEAVEARIGIALK